MIGQYIQNYKIIAHLGEGGMGVVYKAADNILGREVALKMLHTSMTRQPQVLERFKKEAQVLARLLHPNIAVIYNFIEQDSQYYMVMEYVEGKNLDALARVHNILQPKIIAAMFIQALEGLHHAHRKGIFHRDIKPSNLILTPEGTIKLMDFGIAKIAGEQRLTQINRVIGTVEFMAPEIIEGKEPSIASDIYATGITMYELLSGRLPFESTSDYNLMQDILKKKPVHLKTLNPAVPPALSSIVMKALEKKPENRFVDAKDFQQALLSAFPDCREADLSGLAIEAIPAYISSAAAPTQISQAAPTRMQAPATVMQQIDKNLLRNKKAPFVLAAVGLLAFLLIFLSISFHKKSNQEELAKKDLTQKDTIKKIVTPPVYTNAPTDENRGGIVVPPEQEAVQLKIVEPATQPVKKNVEKPAVKKKDTGNVEKVKPKSVAPPPDKPAPEPEPVIKYAEKKDVYINSKLPIALRMRETIGSNEDDREQSVTFTVSNPVVYQGITIIKQGALARGSVKIGRIFSTVSIYSVTAANGQEIALKEHDQRKVKHLATERDYTAILIKGTRMSF